jgi:hypothetical protein
MSKRMEKSTTSSARAFGSSPGNPRGGSNADVNEDGQINILDISAVAKGYGKTV